MKDEIFGELEYDYVWSREMNIRFGDKEETIEMLVAGDEEGEFEAGQYEAYKALMDNWTKIQESLLKPILDYYNEKRWELGYDEEFNEYYPEINSTEELLKHINIVGIKVPYAGLYGERSIGISFDCSWNEEDGVGIRLNNEEVVMVGYQDVAL